MRINDLLKIGAITLLALFIFFKVFDPISSGEPQLLTVNDITKFINKIDMENIGLKEEMAELRNELDYWSSTDQAEEIKELSKRPTRQSLNIAIIFMLLFVATTIFMAFLLSNEHDKKLKYKHRINKIKSIINNSNFKNKEKMKELKSM